MKSDIHRSLGGNINWCCTGLEHQPPRYRYVLLVTELSGPCNVRAKRDWSLYLCSAQHVRSCIFPFMYSCPGDNSSHLCNARGYPMPNFIIIQLYKNFTNKHCTRTWYKIHCTDSIIRMIRISEQIVRQSKCPVMQGRVRNSCRAYLQWKWCRLNIALTW